MSEQDSTPDAQRAQYIDQAWDVVRERGRPLLIMFYPAGISIRDVQIEQLHALLTGAGLRRSQPLGSMDVLLQTYGGDPVAAYRLAQVIRDFTKEVTFLIPEFAYSGGTLACLAGEKILLGDYAVLSPIDITLVRETDLPEELAEWQTGGTCPHLVICGNCKTKSSNASARAFTCAMGSR